MVETKYKDIYIDEDGSEVYKKKPNGTMHKLSKWVDSLGYYMVTFRCNGKKIYKRIHRIIAETLIPNPNNYPQVNHINGNKKDNSLKNLEWCTNQYNTKQAYDNGLYVSNKQCPIRATEKETGQIFEYNSIRHCATELKLNRKTITSILKGEKINNNYDYYFEYI